MNVMASVKCRQSIAFGSIFIGGQFSRLHIFCKTPRSILIFGGLNFVRQERSHRDLRSQRSEHHFEFIGCQRQRCPHSATVSGNRSYAILGKRARIVCSVSSFVASRLKVFAALPRTMDRSNAKFSEGVKHLF